MRLLALLALIPSFLTAQSAFLKDPDIVWAIEVEQDWVIDIPSLEDEQYEGITTIKLLRTEQNQSSYLADLVFQAALKGELPIFKDPYCQAKSDFFKEYPRIDSMITFDPETYEEKKIARSVEVYPFRNFKAWRLRQVLAYHQKSATWSTTVEAIAPLVLIENNLGDSIGTRPLFWFRPDNERQKLTSNQIVWAKKTKNIQPKTRIRTDSMRFVKVVDGFQHPLEHLLGILKTDMKTPFYGPNNENILSPVERTSMLAAQIDTVVTFNPETYEEKLVIVHNEINPDNLHALRLLQTWYWDERRHRLSICLDAVGPWMAVEDFKGNYQYARILFYRRAPR